MLNITKPFQESWQFGVGNNLYIEKYLKKCIQDPHSLNIFALRQAQWKQNLQKQRYNIQLGYAWALSIAECRFLRIPEKQPHYKMPELAVANANPSILFLIQRQSEIYKS